MSREVDVHEATTHLSRLLAEVEEGAEIIIGRAGRPVARLVPLERRKRNLGFVAGTVPEAFFEPLPDEMLGSWG